jgi:hypothetical protein
MSHVAVQQNLQPDPVIKATYWFATVGSVAERGGRVTMATVSLSIAGPVMARVGQS